VIPESPRVIRPGFDEPLTDVQRLFIVAFDPGWTTGWFVCRVALDELRTAGLRGVALAAADPSVFAWRAGSFKGSEPWQAELMMALVRGTWMHGGGEFALGAESDLFIVVGEDYKSRMIGDDASVLSPVRIQAMFRMLSWRAPFPWVLAGIPDAMNTFTDHRLRMFNLWSGVAGAEGEHQRDATRYGALYLRRAADPQWLQFIESKMPWLHDEEKQKPKTSK